MFGKAQLEMFSPFLVRKFSNGNVLEFNYVDGVPEGDAVLLSEAGKEEFKFVNGQKEVRNISNYF